MKRSVKTAIIITSIILILFVFLTWFYYWSTSFSGDLVWKGSNIPRPKKQLSDLRFDTKGWPWWLGPLNNDHSPINDIKKDWSKGLKKIWEVNYLCSGPKSMVWSCPVIQGNRLVVPGRDETHDYIFCIDPETGKLLWLNKYELDAKINYGQGHRSTPTIDEDKVYTLSREGDVRCHALYDGKLIWKYHLEAIDCVAPEWGYSGSPLIYKDRVILHAGGAAIAVALDKSNGSLRWKAEPAKGCYTTPVAMNWQGKDYILLYHEPALSFLDPETGKTLWDVETGKYATDMTVTTPVVYENYILATTLKGRAGMVVQLTDDRPKRLWQGPAITSYQSNPIIYNGHIYCYNGMPIMNRGPFVCADLKTGETMWESMDIGCGTSIFADGHIIALDIKGNLFLIKPDPQEFRIISEFRGAIPDVKKRTWTKPVIADDKLYLRHGNRLICYLLK